MLKVVESLIGPTPRAPSESQAEEDHVMGATDLALLLVDDELELRRQVPRDARLDLATCRLAAHEDQEIVGVASEPMSAPFEFSVEVV